MRGCAATGTTLGIAASYEGNIDLAGHRLQLPSSIFSSGTITDTIGGGELHLGVDIRGSQDFDANAPSKGNAITVLNCFKPMTANLVRTVMLGDATHLDPVLDLSGIDTPFVLPAATYSMSAAAGATVRVDLGARKTSSRTPIISWTTPSEGVSFAWPDGVTGKGSLVKKEYGLYVAKGLTIIVR